MIVVSSLTRRAVVGSCTRNIIPFRRRDPLSRGLFLGSNNFQLGCIGNKNIIISGVNRCVIQLTIKSCNIHTFQEKQEGEGDQQVEKVKKVDKKVKAKSTFVVEKEKKEDAVVVAMAHSNKFQRLPTTVAPINYDLTFIPNWDDHTFQATTIVDVEVKEAVARILINAVNFQVTKVEFKDALGENVQQAEVNLDCEKELLRMDFAKPLQPGKGVLEIQYNGKVSENLVGFFKSKYKDEQGNDKYHFLTKFEPTFARGCFPCWDEPAIKATFDITLVVPKDLVAVSNMPVKHETTYEADASKKVVKFERSVKMSTYVMAFAVGEFDFVEGRSEDGVVCRVYTPKGKQDRGKFALDVVSKSLTVYKDYFGISYPLPKMDLLAVNEFSCGAMENWGLVIFRESVLLMDEKLSSTITKQYVAIVTAHETAHMWFGNLVTMEWWSDLWLNEGYASFMEFLCIDKIYPEFNIWEQFIKDYFLEALELDSLKNSHPIQVVVGHPSTISSIFDAISYDKGSSVIRMLNNYLGDQDFKKGMNLYLTRHQYGNAETEDLWAALSEASGKPVDKIMPTWTKQMGFPIISVKKIIQQGDEKVITMSYSKFWSDPKLKCSSIDSKWIIPLTVRKQSAPKEVASFSLVEEEPGKEFEITVPATAQEWVKLNADLIGYYIVSYPSEILAQFVPSIQDRTMGPVDRLGLLSELFLSVKSGDSSSEDVLRILGAYSDETNDTVWGVINNIVGTYKNILAGTELEEKFRTFSLRLFEKIVHRLGWNAEPGESSQDSLLRTFLLIRMISLDHKPTIEEAKRRFDLHVKGETLLHADLKPPVYRAIMASGDLAGFDSLVEIYKTSDLLEEKIRILRAFGAARDPVLINKVLSFAMSKHVNKQDVITVLISFSTKEGRELAWEFFKENYKFFQTNFPTGGGIIRRAVKMIAENFTTEDKANDIRKFFKEHEFKGTEPSVEQALEHISINVNLLQRDTAVLTKMLSSYD